MMPESQRRRSQENQIFRRNGLLSRRTTSGKVKESHRDARLITGNGQKPTYGSFNKRVFSPWQLKNSDPSASPSISQNAGAPRTIITYFNAVSPLVRRPDTVAVILYRDIP